MHASLDMQTGMLLVPTWKRRSILPGLVIAHECIQLHLNDLLCSPARFWHDLPFGTRRVSSLPRTRSCGRHQAGPACGLSTF